MDRSRCAATGADWRSPNRLAHLIGALREDDQVRPGAMGLHGYEISEELAADRRGGYRVINRVQSQSHYILPLTKTSYGGSVELAG